MRPRNVCVLGGSGFVGSHLCPALAGAGHHVTVPTRDPERARHLRVLPTVRVMRCDVHDSTQLATALAGHDAVVNLVGIARESRRRGGSFRAAHRDLAHKVVAACREAQIDRLLHMSAINADADRGPSRFLRSKGRAERIVREEGGPDFRWTIFRPSAIFGRGDSFAGALAKALRAVPLAMPLAMPTTRLAPVWVGDVAAAIATALGDDDSAGESYDLCGPEVLTLREVACFIRDELGLRKAIIPLPWLASRALAAVMDFVPGARFSSDACRSLSVDAVCAGNGFHRLGLQAQSLRGITPRHLGLEGARTEYARFRSRARR